MKKFNVVYMLLIFIVAFNLRLAISSVPPIQGMIQKSLMLSNLQISLLTGIPVVCMGVFAFSVERVQRQFGIQKSIYYLSIFLAIMTFARIFSFNYFILIVTTFGIGIAIAIIGPLLSGFIKEEFPDYTSILIAIYSFSMGTGSLLVSKVTNTIAVKTGDNWAFALAVWGVFGIIASVAWKKYSHEDGQLTEQAKVRVNYLDMNIWKMVFFFGIQSGIFYSFGMYLIPFLEAEGIQKEHLISFLTLFVAAQMLLGFVIPVIMHKVGSTRSWGIFNSVCLVIGLAMPLVFPVDIVMATLSIVFLAVGLGGAFPIAMIMPLDYSSNANEASIITGVVQAFGYILGGVTPIVFGLIIDATGTYRSIFYIMILGAIIMTFIALTGIQTQNEN